MQKSQWRLQDAKARFSQVVEAALQGEPQHVTRRGRDAVVILSEQAYRHLQQYSRAEAPGFVAHLLAIPKVKQATTAPVDIKLRDVDL
jgi:prevent-host-death family protein